MTGKILYGYRRVNGAVEIDPEAAEKVRRFFELANSGIHIQEAGSMAGLNKSTSYLYKMARDAAYAGEKGYPAIIHPDQVGMKVARKRMATMPILTGFHFGPIPDAVDDVNPADYVSMLYDAIEGWPLSKLTALSPEQMDPLPSERLDPLPCGEEAAETVVEQPPAEEKKPPIVVSITVDPTPVKKTAEAPSIQISTSTRN